MKIASASATIYAESLLTCLLPGQVGSCMQLSPDLLTCLWIYNPHSSRGTPFHRSLHLLARSGINDLEAVGFGRFYQGLTICLWCWCWCWWWSRRGWCLWRCWVRILVHWNCTLWRSHSCWKRDDLYIARGLVWPARWRLLVGIYTIHAPHRDGAPRWW